MYWKLSPDHPEPPKTGQISYIIYQHVRKKVPSVSFLANISFKKWLLLFILLTIVSFISFNEFMPKQFRGWIRVPPKVNFHCHRITPELVNDISDFTNSKLEKFKEKLKNSRLRADSKILVFVETQYSKLGKEIIEILDSVRFKYKTEISGKSLPLLTNSDKGKYSVIIFENLFKYFKMNRWNRDLLDKYCREYNIGIIGFYQSIESAENSDKTNGNHPLEKKIIIKHLDNLPVRIKIGYHLKDYQLNSRTDLLRISRAGAISLGPVDGKNWSVFEIPRNSSSFFPVAQAFPVSYVTKNYPGGYKYSSMKKLAAESYDSQNFSNHVDSYKANLLTTVLQDNGSFDGIRRVLFGNGLNFWIHKIVFLDALSYLSHGKLSLPLQRYLLIDIDDIFVGERGTRLKPPDVMALLDFQRRLQLLIPGFKLNLGFSGKFYHRGFPEENKGDDLLIKYADHFWWFCHMFSHSQAHLTNNLSHIENEMILNRKFAKTNKLPVVNDYTVSPHHSGVYPVHEPLYQAWKKIWNIRVTSTEEYPHLRPAHLRRGFIHQGVMVLPRQTCGLYTHTIFIDKYPGGRDKLENSIFGGELFQSFIMNQINVFMTHQSNYANDQLALYTFESVIKFVQCWTNLQLLTLPPVQLAKKYFQIHPEDKDPIWMNPCDDKRHYNIWSLNKSCFQFPKFLILGPQKTGSTALYSFLSMHPSVKSNLPSAQNFEEVQFFNGKNYYKGIDWYMSFFPLQNDTIIESEQHSTSSTGNVSTVHRAKNLLRNPPPFKEGPPYFFEKSSNYFDGELVPMRVHSLLPHAKLVVILISPLKRAYSWYQHQRAHNLSVALEFTFYEVVSLDINTRSVDEVTLKKLRELRNRCLSPGTYAVHLEHWLSYFPPQQIMIMDGDELRYNPINVMEKLQTFFKLEPHIDYRKMIRFDSRKGFYCQITNANNTKCLGKSKGRIYPEMDDEARTYLHNYYLHHNIALSKLLNRLRVPIPSWLEMELSTNQ